MYDDVYKNLNFYNILITNRPHCCFFKQYRFKLCISDKFNQPPLSFNYNPSSKKLGSCVKHK